MELHNSLGAAYSVKKDVQEAFRHYRMALDIDPNHSKAHRNLGVGLANENNLDEAIKHFLRAIDINPDYAEAHYGLGRALDQKKDLSGAIKQYSKALEIKPNYAEAHVNLGRALHNGKDLEEAIKHYRQALDINPVLAEAHANLGDALRVKKDVEGAMMHYQKFLGINPKSVRAHDAIGALLHNEKKDSEGAINYFRKALDIDSKDSKVLENLGIAYNTICQSLIRKDQIAEARETAADWLKLLPAGHPHRKNAQQQIQHCDQLLVAEKQLSLILNGGDPPDNAIELFWLADLCVRCKNDYVAATRFFATAIEKQPKLGDDLNTPHRYNAACAASLAAAGNGKNAEKLQDQDKAKLRRLALDWLRADLALWRQQRKSGNAQDLQRLIETLAHWQRDPDLIFGRDARELAKLPEDEREPWRELWADVARLLMEAKAAPATGDGSECTVSVRPTFKPTITMRRQA